MGPAWIYDAGGFLRTSLTGRLGDLTLHPASYLKVVFTSDSSGSYRTFEAVWKEFATFGLSTSPYTFQVQESSNFSVNCSRYTTWGNLSTPTYKWTRGGKTVSTGAVIVTRNISRSQAGNYLCTARHAAGSASVNISVDVQHAPSIDGPSVYKLTEHSLLEIDCSDYTTPGSPPFTSYTWTYDGSTVTHWGILYRSSISRRQGGEYTCTASNTQGSDSHSVNVDVQYGPTIDGLPLVHKVREKSRLKIDCSNYTIPGNPPNTRYKWTYGGSTVSTKAVLDRRNISRSESGTYICSVRNNIVPLYLQMDRTSAVNVYVQYIDEPRLTIVEEEVKENDTVTMSCEVASNPTAKLVIRKYYNVRNGKRTNRVSRTIIRAGCLDSGRYICSAVNTVAGRDDSKTLNVLCSPRQDHRKQLDSVVTGHKNQSVSFRADIIANPRPNFTWYRYDGQVMSSVINGASRSYDTSIESILQINITSDDDYGHYYVEAENSEGRVMLPFTLTAASPPAAPSQVRLLVVGDTSVSLNWISGYNGGANQTFMLQYKSETHPIWSVWRDDITDPGRGGLVKEDVQSLTPATTYQFHLYGVNVYGDGEGVTITTTTSSSSKFKLMVGFGTFSGAIVVSILAVVCIFLIRTSGKREITNPPAGDIYDNVYTYSVPKRHCQDAELECVYEVVMGNAEEDLYCNAAGLNNGDHIVE
ncbi:neural cell adhesion molecule 2-like [Haliotis asinina]|uniref:neural cell adhesion molecule 2-like n=1 Tax=Haliotis asinina TaxID=109174 RepID=UPI0035325BF3